MRPVLERHYVFRAAVVRRLRRAVCPPDGRGCDVRGLRQRAAQLG